LTGWSKNC